MVSVLDGFLFKKILIFVFKKQINLDIYSLPMEMHFQQDQMNFILKLVEWFKIPISQALQLAPDYVDELLQKFDGLSNQLIDKYNNNSILVYLDFWKKMYIAAILFCTQTPRYAKFFNQPINYKFLSKFDVKS